MIHSKQASMLGKRGFFWGRKTAIQAAPLIEKNEELKILQYRGKIDDFNNRAHIFEKYLRGEEEADGSITIEKQLIEGRCTGVGS